MEMVVHVSSPPHLCKTIVEFSNIPVAEQESKLKGTNEKQHGEAVQSRAAVFV